MTVTNIDTGDSASGQTFTYLVKASAPIVTSVSPSSGLVGAGGLDLIVTGQNLLGTTVTFGTQNLTVSSNTGTSFTIHIPPTATIPAACPTGVTPPGPINDGTPIDLTVTNPVTGCTSTFKGAFQYLISCS